MLTANLTKEVSQKLKDENPGVTLDVIENEVVAPGISFIFKRPGDAEWKRYRSMQANDEQASLANRTLVLGQLLDPTPSELLEMLKSQPGLVDTLAVKVREAAGASNASTLRKL